MTSNLSLFFDNKSEYSNKVNSTNVTTQVSELLKDFPKGQTNSMIDKYNPSESGLKNHNTCETKSLSNAS